MAEFLDEKRSEIAARLKELKPLVDEYARLEAAAAALDGVAARAGHATARPRAAAPAMRPRQATRRGAAAGKRPRPPEGQRHARQGGARARHGEPRDHDPASSPRRWASSRTTSTASCRASPRTASSRKDGPRLASQGRGLSLNAADGPRVGLPRADRPTRPPCRRAAARQAAICRIVSTTPAVERVGRRRSPRAACCARCAPCPRTMPSWWVNVLTACMAPNAVPRHGATRVS